MAAEKMVTKWCSFRNNMITTVHRTLSENTVAHNVLRSARDARVPSTLWSRALSQNFSHALSSVDMNDAYKFMRMR